MEINRYKHVLVVPYEKDMGQIVLIAKYDTK